MIHSLKLGWFYCLLAHYVIVLTKGTISQPVAKIIAVRAASVQVLIVGKHAGDTDGIGIDLHCEACPEQSEGPRSNHLASNGAVMLAVTVLVNNIAKRRYYPEFWI
jgi:hypothetical protein